MTPYCPRLTLQRSRPPTFSVDYIELEEIRTLTCINVVCRNGPEVLRLPHVIKKLHEFLDWSGRWTFTKACSANFQFLVQRLTAQQELLPLDSGLRFPGVRQWQFTQGLLKAVAVGNLELVKLLSSVFSGCHVRVSVVEEAAKRGKTNILQWLVVNRNDVRWTDREVAAAIRGGHFDLAKWMKDKISTVSLEILKRWAATAAGKGNLEMFRWVCNLSTVVNPRNAVHEAVDNGHLEVVKWIMSHPDRDASGDDDRPRHLQINLYRATTGGYFDVLEWLLLHHPNRCRLNGADIEAAQNGRLEIAHLFYESNVECCPDRAFASAVAGGHLDIVKLLYDHQLEESLPGQVIDLAARNGYIDIVKWLHENSSEDCTTFGMDGAAMNSHLEMVQWLHKHRPTAGCTNVAMDSAAGNGNLELVKWLHTHRKEGCSPNAMDLAAANGHLEVVEWLHTNRDEGCTTDAMGMAAAHGHLNAVIWLQENRSEGCTTEAMDRAAENGHLQILEWLHSRRTEGCTVRSMDAAARNNHLEVVQWLDAYKTEGSTTAAMDSAAEQGHREMVQWLDRHRHEGCTSAAVELAVLGGHFEIVSWISQRYSEYDVVDTLRGCPDENRRWEFGEWMYLHEPAHFESTIAERLFA